MSDTEREEREKCEQRIVSDIVGCFKSRFFCIHEISGMNIDMNPRISETDDVWQNMTFIDSDVNTNESSHIFSLMKEHAYDTYFHSGGLYEMAFCVKAVAPAFATRDYSVPYDMEKERKQYAEHDMRFDVHDGILPVSYCIYIERRFATKEDRIAETKHIVVPEDKIDVSVKDQIYRALYAEMLAYEARTQGHFSDGKHYDSPDYFKDNGIHDLKMVYDEGLMDSEFLVLYDLDN